MASSVLLCFILPFFCPLPKHLGLQQETCTVGLGVGAAGKAHPSFLAVNRVHTHNGCLMLPCCPVVFYPSTGNGDQEKYNWSRVKTVFLSFLTQLHSLFLSAFPSLSLLFSSPQSHLFGMPFLNGCGVGWMSPGGKAMSLPAPPGAVLLSCCWELPAGQLVSSAVQSKLRYLAQSLSSFAWGWMQEEWRGGNTSPHCAPLRKKPVCYAARAPTMLLLNLPFRLFARLTSQPFISDTYVISC